MNSLDSDGADGQTYNLLDFKLVYTHRIYYNFFLCRLEFFVRSKMACLMLMVTQIMMLIIEDDVTQMNWVFYITFH